jgi:carboxyl-terminal processing protease
MKSNKEYAYMLEDIKIIDDRDEDKPVSLNETKMKTERDENDLKTLNRENDRRAARGLAPLKKGENKPKGEKPYDFMLEEGCNIVADWLSLK